MKRTDWDEILNFYNGVFNLHFKTHRAMIRNGYKRFGSMEELALKLGVSRETLRKKVKGDKNVEGIYS